MGRKQTLKLLEKEVYEIGMGYVRLVYSRTYDMSGYVGLFLK